MLNLSASFLTFCGYDESITFTNVVSNFTKIHLGGSSFVVATCRCAGVRQVISFVTFDAHFCHLLKYLTESAILCVSRRPFLAYEHSMVKEFGERKISPEAINYQQKRCDQEINGYIAWCHVHRCRLRFLRTWLVGFHIIACASDAGSPRV